MKFNYLIKAVPFLSTLILIIFLCFSNQKENTKLRILIWYTPSLTLGNSLAISIGTGFLFSYLITTNLAKTSKSVKHNSLKYKDENNHEEINEYTESNTNQGYDNTLIERDIKEPLPTINASFRVIGKIEKNNTHFKYKTNKNDKYYNSNEFEEKYGEQFDRNDAINKEMTVSNDWTDESFSRW